MTAGKTRSWPVACLLAALLLPAPGTVAWAAATQPAVIFKDCPECPEMVALPAGSFLMGVAGAAEQEPVHPVTLKRPFAMGRTEVTEEQFRYFLARTGYDAGPGHSSASFAPRLPAVEIDWHAADAYARWLSRRTGKSYRLPSEAEWEYAARAGTATRYWWGDAAGAGCGKELLPATFFAFNEECAGALTREVGEVASLAPNPWGLFDMLGNAGEWVSDSPPAGTTGYLGAPADGAPFTGGIPSRDAHRMRGRGYIGDAAPRQSDFFEKRSASIGFRVVRELP